MESMFMNTFPYLQFTLFSASEAFDGTYPTNVVVTSEGKCTYIPPGIFMSTCKIDITWFPFDDQNCEMKFGSWTYNGFKVGDDVWICIIVVVELNDGEKEQKGWFLQTLVSSKSLDFRRAVKSRSIWNNQDLKAYFFKIDYDIKERGWQMPCRSRQVEWAPDEVFQMPKVQQQNWTPWVATPPTLEPFFTQASRVLTPKVCVFSWISNWKPPARGET